MLRLCCTSVKSLVKYTTDFTAGFTTLLTGAWDANPQTLRIDPDYIRAAYWWRRAAEHGKSVVKSVVMSVVRSSQR